MSTPKLRFKEFDEDWSKFSILDLSKDKALNNGVFNDQNKVGKGYKLINVLDMYIERDIDEDRLSLLDLDSKEFERNKVKYGDIFFTRSSLVKEGIAFSNVYLGNANDITYDGHLIKLSPDLERINPLFLNFSLKTSNVRKQLIQGGKTATMTTIGQKEVGSCQLNIPSKEEQTKIASFLSQVDEKISQLNQKHSLLSQYKQGMMQKLFSQQIRFKADDGSEFGEWQEKQLGDVCHFINGRAYKQTEWEKEGTPVIRLQNLTGSGKEYYYSTLNLPDHQYCYNNDLLYMWSATFGPIFWQGEKAIFHYHIWKIEVKPQQLDKQYMYYLLDEMTEKMKSSLNGSTMLHVTKQGMESTKKNLPSIEEQTKIANFLSAIDQKIDVVSEQLEQAKLWKKGLLQQMFV